MRVTCVCGCVCVCVRGITKMCTKFYNLKSGADDIQIKENHWTCRDSWLFIIAIQSLSRKGEKLVQ